jgi:hypothetical protein
VPFEIEDETQSYLYKKRENHKVFLMGFYQTEKSDSNFSNEITPGILRRSRLYFFLFPHCYLVS